MILVRVYWAILLLLSLLYLAGIRLVAIEAIFVQIMANFLVFAAYWLHGNFRKMEFDEIFTAACSSVGFVLLTLYLLITNSLSFSLADILFIFSATALSFLFFERRADPLSLAELFLVMLSSLMVHSKNVGGGNDALVAAVIFFTMALMMAYHLSGRRLRDLRLDPLTLPLVFAAPLAAALAVYTYPLAGPPVAVAMLSLAQIAEGLGVTARAGRQGLSPRSRPRA